MVASAAGAGCAATATHRAVAANTSAVPTADLRNDPDPREKIAKLATSATAVAGALSPQSPLSYGPTRSGQIRTRTRTPEYRRSLPGGTGCRERSSRPGPASSWATRQRGMARTPRMRAPRTDASARQSPGAQPRTPAPGRRACHSERQALPSFAAACHKEIPLNEIEIRRRRTPVREPHEQSVQLEATARARRIVMQVSTRRCSTVTGNRRKLRPRTLAKVNWLLLCRRLPARSASGPGRPGPKP